MFDIGLTSTSPHFEKSGSATGAMRGAPAAREHASSHAPSRRPGRCGRQDRCPARSRCRRPARARTAERTAPPARSRRGLDRKRAGRRPRRRVHARGCRRGTSGRDVHHGRGLGFRRLGLARRSFLGGGRCLGRGRGCRGASRREPAAAFGAPELQPRGARPSITSTTCPTFTLSPGFTFTSETRAGHRRRHFDRRLVGLELEDRLIDLARRRPAPRARGRRLPFRCSRRAQAA